MLLKIFSILFIISSTFLSQTKIFEQGFKKYDWNSNIDQILQTIPDDYLLTHHYVNKISDSDTLIHLYYSKKEREDKFGRVSIEYLYEFSFLNRKLYEINLDVISEQSEEFSFITDFRKAYHKDIINDYGQTKKSWNHERSIGDVWENEYLRIELRTVTEYIEGMTWVREMKTDLSLLLLPIKNKIENIKNEYAKKLSEIDKQENDKRIKEFRDDD